MLCVNTFLRGTPTLIKKLLLQDYKNGKRRYGDPAIPGLMARNMFHYGSGDIAWINFVTDVQTDNRKTICLQPPRHKKFILLLKYHFYQYIFTIFYTGPSHGRGKIDFLNNWVRNWKICMSQLNICKMLYYIVNSGKCI